MSQTGGCRCGCGGHGKRNEQDERAAASTLSSAMQSQSARGFDDAIDELGLAPVWVGYRDDRRWGRAREALAAHGVRPTVVRPISEVVK